jgi:putative copper resistance protein D
VLAKVAALTVLGGFGWWHRKHTVAVQVSRAGTGSGRRDAARLFLNVAAAELVVMASTVALAVGLSRTPTPAGDAVHTSVAASLLGFPLPPRPTWSRVAFGWVPDGFALAFLVLAVALYVAGVLTLRRRGDRWPVGRTVCWAAGLLVFAWATVGGLGLYSHVMFSAHMVAHMLLSMVAPIGLVLGAPVTLALRALPGPRVPGELGPRQLLLAVLHSRVARVVMHPLVAFALFVGSLYGIYFTSLFATLMSNHLGHVVMEFHFLAVGFLFFFVLVGVDPTPVRLPSIARIGLLFAAMPSHAFFSVAIMGGDTLLAPSYFRSLHRPYSTDLLGDQHLGGGIGWALGEVPVLLVLGAVFIQWARTDAHEAARFDRAADRADRRAVSGETPVDDEFSRYNAYLASLAERDGRAGGAGRAAPPRDRPNDTHDDERTPR